MKIEVGDYVRTRNGIIFMIDKDKLNLKFNAFQNVGGDRDIIKYSKNIIDLIELYDYVNNFLVFDIITYENDDKKIQLSTGVIIGNNEIESVVTHEQFSNIEYKVEE